MKVEKQDSSLWGPLWMSTVSLQINFFPFSPLPAVSGRLAPDYSNRLLRCLSRVQPAGGSSGSSEVGVLNPPIYPLFGLSFEGGGAPLPTATAHVSLGQFSLLFPSVLGWSLPPAVTGSRVFPLS